LVRTSSSSCESVGTADSDIDVITGVASQEFVPDSAVSASRSSLLCRSKASGSSRAPVGTGKRSQLVRKYGVRELTEKSAIDMGPWGKNGK
jgi:hypothetical protein